MVDLWAFILLNHRFSGRGRLAARSRRSLEGQTRQVDLDPVHAMYAPMSRSVATG